MIEIELKIPLKNPKKFEGEIARLDAKFIREETHEDHYFQHPCRNFKSSDEALRLRISDLGIVLSYKGPKLSQEIKMRREIEVSVSDFNSITRILRALGFIEVATIHKQRKIYKYADYKIAVDKVYELGDYVEIETIVNSMEEKDYRISDLRELADKLGLSIKDNIVKSYLEIYFEKH